MQKHCKKLFSFITAVLLVVLSVTAVCAKSYIVDTDGAKYEMLSDGTVVFSGYEGDYGIVVVPGEFQYKPVVKVDNFALKNNTVVEQIDFTYAVNLQRIGLYAFSGCENLAFVDVPASVSSVGFSAFRDCTSLYRASFLGNGTKVPDETFLNCSSLEIVELSPDLTEIGDFAFANCTALEYLELPASVTAIGNNAFLNDENLTLGVYYGSFAQSYAEENGIPYVIIGGVKLGDVNGDKVVNINDVTAIQSHLAEMNKLEGIFLKAADVNQNGDVKIDDATALQMYLAEYEVQYPVDEEMPKS